MIPLLLVIVLKFFTGSCQCKECGEQAGRGRFGPKVHTQYDCKRNGCKCCRHRRSFDW